MRHYPHSNQLYVCHLKFKTFQSKKITTNHFFIFKNNDFDTKSCLKEKNVPL